MARVPRRAGEVGPLLAGPVLQEVGLPAPVSHARGQELGATCHMGHSDSNSVTCDMSRVMLPCAGACTRRGAAPAARTRGPPAPGTCTNMVTEAEKRHLF